MASSVAAVENGVILGEIYGGPHGDKYSDLDTVSPGQTVQSITIRTGERVNGVGLEITDDRRVKSALYHGGHGGDKNTLSLTEGEYITGMEAHWGKTWSKTRIKYIKFTTSAGNSISGGSKTESIGKDTAPKGYQPGGFVGYAGKELDSVGAIWTSIESVD